MQHIPIGLIIYDYRKKIYLINNTAREVLSISEKEDLNNALRKRKFNTLDKASVKPNAAYDTSHFYYYRMGTDELVLYRRELPCNIGGNEFVLSAFIDITPIDKERKFEAAANIAKSDFLAKMSHEIRTPMNGIFGMAEALEKENLSETQNEYIRIIRRSAELLLNIIDDILDYSKIEAGKMQIEDVPYRLREEVNLSVDIFRTIFEEKELLVEVIIDEKVPDRIIGDPFRLRQVLTNLISNAVKFTHEGKIVVKVELEEEYSGNLTLLFTVADTGVGIPKEKLETIFDKFTQADRSTSRQYGGSGLGTTICKQLVTLMNGEIWVESPSSLSMNKRTPGSAFHFTIEVFSNEILPKKVDFTQITRLDQAHFLIISSQIETKKRLFNFFEHFGISISAIQSSENVFSEVESKLKSEGERIQGLIIFDEPGLDGLWLAGRLHSEGHTTYYRIIMLGTEYKSDYYLQTRLQGVDYYLGEPFEHKLLLNYLRECFPAVQVAQSEGVTLRNDISILVAEDNIINQKVAQNIFKNCGQTIDLAADGNEAIELVKTKAYDIVFLDLEMPEKDGFEAALEIRRLGFQMPIIAMTASVSLASKTQALQTGMNEYITKPVKAETIQAMLEKWFA